MPEIIAIIIFGLSVLGIAVIILKKIPVLASLSLDNPKQENVLGAIKNRLQNNKHLKPISREVLLQKILSKIRVFTLKIEEKTSARLKSLRQKSLQKKKSNFSEDYWEKLRENKDKPE